MKQRCLIGAFGNDCNFAVLFNLGAIMLYILHGDKQINLACVRHVENG